MPAISHFTATVYDKSGLIESRLTMTPWKQVCAPPQRTGCTPDMTLLASNVYLPKHDAVRGGKQARRLLGLHVFFLLHTRAQCFDQWASNTFWRRPCI